MFNKYAGHDKQLDEIEFNQVLYGLGIKAISPGAFKMADLNADGSVSFEEFKTYYAFLKKDSRGVSNSNQKYSSKNKRRRF